VKGLFLDYGNTPPAERPWTAPLTPATVMSRLDQPAGMEPYNNPQTVGDNRKRRSCRRLQKPRCLAVSVAVPVADPQLATYWRMIAQHLAYYSRVTL
jgi:hypothetical protein